MDEPSPLRGGAVSRLNQEAGFGYVDDDDSKHRFIFVFGHSIRHSQARGLSVGSRVRFRLAEGDRSAAQALELESEADRPWQLL